MGPREWDWGDNAESGVTLRFDESFDEQVRRLRSRDGGAFKIGGHNYHVLRALWAGYTLNGYTARPIVNGMPINNVRSRIADLRHKWNIVIGSRTASGKQYKEWILKGREDG